MGETGFTCPECGNAGRFTASCYIVSNTELSITPDGWLDIGKHGDMELPASADLRCWNCGHEDNWRTFIDE